MAVNTKFLVMVTISMFSVNAMAELTQKKEVTRIDFNKMIDENNSERADLQREIVKKEVSVNEDGATDAEKQKVYDFVDMEVGSGKTRPVVDRRFNSVGTPRVANFETKSEMTVQLIAKRK